MTSRPIPKQVFFIPDALSMTKQDDFVHLDAPIVGGTGEKAQPEFDGSHFGVTDFNVGAAGRRSWVGAILHCRLHNTTAHRLLL